MTNNVNVPPNNIDAEKSVLGAMLIDSGGDAIQNAIDTLQVLDFYYPAHREIFSAMIALYSARVPIDLITVQEELSNRNKLDEIGGISYLTGLTEIVPTTLNNKVYINIVEEKSLLRQLINAGTLISTMAYSEDDKVRDIIEKSEGIIYNISNAGAKSDFKDIKTLLISTYDWIDERVMNKGTPPGLDTGFNQLDYITGGLQKGELIILAARPSMGKTALAMNIAVNCAKKGATVGVFSLEMSAEELTRRLVSSEGKADMSTFKKGEFKQRELDKIVKAAETIHQTNLFIDDTNVITPINMLTKARKLKAENNGKLDLIVIDYLQIVTPPRDYKNDNREVKVAMISQGIKTLAREMNCPVLCLAQMNRDVEKRSDKNKRPTLSDLRESGSIEQDADIVMFLNRPNKETYEESIASGEIVDGEVQDLGNGEDCELVIAKHRNGPTGTVKLKFLNKFVTFVSVDNVHEDES